MCIRGIDAKIANELGWGVMAIMGDDVRWWVTPRGEGINASDFSPSASIDALRKWVLLEIERRGLANEFFYRMCCAVSGNKRLPLYRLLMNIIEVEPIVMAVAALETLEAGK